MSWRDRYTGKGKLRGAEFLVKSSDMTFGRRVAVHEYPQRDVPYVEDLGLKGREFTLDVFVIGPDYHIARDALIVAIEQPGPATLVHPYLGTLRVSVVNARKRESAHDGGRCQFTLTLVVGGENQYPAAQIDTQAAVDAQADKSLTESINDFSSTFDVVGLVADQVAEVEAELDSVLGAIDNVVGSVTEPLASLIRTPANLGTALAGSVSRISALVSTPIRAISLYKNLFGTGSNRPIIPTTTPSRRQQAATTTALYNLVKQTALTEACRSSSQANYAAYDDAIDVRDALLDELDVQMQDAAVTDVLYTQFVKIRVAVVNDIRTRGADLSRLKTHTPLTTLPVLVIAHQLYGDAQRADEIISRNTLRHPGFVPGGDALEVLNA